MELLVKAIMGALIVVAISLIASTKNYFLVGLITLFPTFSLIAHIIIGRNRPVELKTTALFGMLSVIPFFAYLFSVYLLSNKVPLYLNILLSLLAWLFFAATIYLLWIKFKVTIT